MAVLVAAWVLVTTLLVVSLPASAQDDGGSQVLVAGVDAENWPDVRATVSIPGDLITAGVAPEQLMVFEDGVEVPAQVRQLTGAVDAVIVIDTSGSMKGDALPLAADAARTCLAGLPLGSSSAILAYSDIPVLLQPATTDLIAASRTLDGLVALGETATHDALVGAAAQFGPQTVGPDGPRSRFIVLLSDGDDTTSVSSLPQAISSVSATDAGVFALAMQTSDTNNETLAAIADGTGGVLLTGGPTELVDLCRAITTQISNRWEVAWSSTTTGPTRIDFALRPGAVGAASTVTGDPDEFGAGDSSADLGDPLPIATLGIAPPGSGGGAGLPDLGAGISGASGAPEALASSDETLMADGMGSLGGSGGGDGGPSGDNGLLSRSGSLWVGAGAVFTGMASLFGLGLSAMGEKASLRRVKVRDTVSSGSVNIKFGAFGDLASQAGQLGDSLLKRGGFTETLNVALDRAGVGFRPGEFVAAVSGVAVAAFLAFALAGFGPAALGAFLLAPLLANVWLKMRMKKQLKAFQDQLVETLMIMAGSVRAGHGLMQSISSVAEQGSEPTSSQFSRVIAETRIGRDPIDALNAMAERVGSPDLVWTVRAMALNRELGGNLAEILDNVASTIRDRNKVADQVRALSAEGKFSAYVLFGLPFGVVFAVRILNPEYIEPLFTTTAGYTVIGIALGLMSVGAIWIRKMVQIEL